MKLSTKRILSPFATHYIPVFIKCCPIFILYTYTYQNRLELNYYRIDRDSKFCIWIELAISCGILRSIEQSVKNNDGKYDLCRTSHIQTDPLWVSHSTKNVPPILCTIVKRIHRHIKYYWIAHTKTSLNVQSIQVCASRWQLGVGTIGAVAATYCTSWISYM